MQEENEFLVERYELAAERIRQIKEESYGDEKMDRYFRSVAGFIGKVADYYEFVQSGKLLSGTLEELQRYNYSLYEDILPQNYAVDYTNPIYAVKMLGETYGIFFSALAAEMRSMILPATQQSLEEVLIRMELFVELYGSCAYEWQESAARPAYENLRQILYWYVSDYTDLTEEVRMKKRLGLQENHALQILMEADLSQPAYLYRYGAYVSEKEKKTAALLAELSQETIDLMAKTYTEAYGTGKAEISYALGFERIFRKVVKNLIEMGMQPTVSETPAGILQGGVLQKSGPVGANPNKQYDLDHKEDKALVWDKAMAQRKAQVHRSILEKYQQEAISGTDS